LSFTLTNCKALVDSWTQEAVSNADLLLWGRECLRDNIPSRLWLENTKLFRTSAKKFNNLPPDFVSLVSLFVSIGYPTGLTVTPTGTAGTTTYGYRVTAISSDNETIACTEVKATTGNATLTAINYNALSWTAVTGASSYAIYRTTGGTTQGLIGTATTTTFNDTGLAGDGESVPIEDTTGIKYTNFTIRNRKISFFDADTYAMSYIARPTVANITDNVPLIDACEYAIAKYIASRYRSAEDPDDADASRWMQEFYNSIANLINENELDSNDSFQTKAVW